VAAGWPVGHPATDVVVASLMGGACLRVTPPPASAGEILGHPLQHAHGRLVDVLEVIEAAEQAGTPATVSSVSAAVSIDQPRASSSSPLPVEAGHVRREADQGDGRRALLVPTDAAAP